MKNDPFAKDRLNVGFSRTMGFSVNSNLTPSSYVADRIEEWFQSGAETLVFYYDGNAVNLKRDKSKDA